MHSREGGAEPSFGSYNTQNTAHKFGRSEVPFFSKKVLLFRPPPSPFYPWPGCFVLVQVIRVCLLRAGKEKFHKIIILETNNIANKPLEGQRSLQKVFGLCFSVLLLPIRVGPESFYFIFFFILFFLSENEEKERKRIRDLFFLEIFVINSFGLNFFFELGNLLVALYFFNLFTEPLL